MPFSPHCVVDTVVVVLANAPVRKHASPAQRSRWALLRCVCQLRVTALKSKSLHQEYVEHLKGKELAEAVRAFIKALDQHGVVNDQSLRHHEIAICQGCRFPVSHDAHLVRAAKGIEGVLIATEEKRALASGDCMRRELGIRVLAPADALEHWGLS